MGPSLDFLNCFPKGKIFSSWEEMEGGISAAGLGLIDVMVYGRAYKMKPTCLIMP